MEKRNEDTVKSVDDILYEAANSEPVVVEPVRTSPVKDDVLAVEAERRDSVDPDPTTVEDHSVVDTTAVKVDEPPVEATVGEASDPAEVDTEPSVVKADSYFEDDEIAVERANDEVVYSDDLSSILQQADDVVAFEVKNFYTDNGVPRSRFAMRNDPPVLSVQSGSDQYASFVLTEHFAQYLVAALNNVDRAYHGKEPLLPGEKEKSKASFKGSFQRSVEYIANHPMKSLLVALVMGLIIYGLVRF